MTDAPAAFQATVHGFRTVPSRKVVQITVEAPIEQHATIARIAEHGAWLALARLQTPPEKSETHKALEASVEKERRLWAEMTPTAQACMRCKEPIFQQYVIEKRNFNELDDKEKNAAVFIRRQCNINTRAMLSTNKSAAAIWRSIDSDFNSWKQVERALG